MEEFKLIIESRSKNILTLINPKSVKQIKLSQTQPNEPITQLREIIKINKTSLNCVDQISKQEENEKEKMEKKCAESEKNVRDKILKEEFMSVRGDQPNENLKGRAGKTHKKGNKSMNLRPEPSGNQLLGMNVFDDFDLKTLDLGHSEVKT